MRSVLAALALAVATLVLGSVDRPAVADEKPEPPPPLTAAQKKKQEALDELLKEPAAKAPEPASSHPAAATASAKTPPPESPPVDEVRPAPAKPPAAKPPAPVAAPITDDNDTTAPAAPPAPLQAVTAVAVRRIAGPYELTTLDCRVLDGAGVERLLPKRILLGEEPDLLCRVLVTQPANVTAAAHQLTLTVSLGNRVTYQQTRNVRMSSLGRRAVLFVIPADRIGAEETARLSVRVALSAPARPAFREVKLTIESED